MKDPWYENTFSDVQPLRCIPVDAPGFRLIRKLVNGKTKQIPTEAILCVEGLPVTCTVGDLKALFALYGTICWARLIVDANGHSTVFGYVELSSAEEADTALAGVKSLSGKDPVLVTRCTDLIQRRTFLNMILVSGLSPSTTSAFLKGLFAPYGEVSWTRLVNDTDGRTVTFGYVDMASQEGAENAIQALHGTTVMGKTIAVHLTNDILVKRTS